MSLINKMLKDLEARNGASGRAERPIFQDLHAVTSVRRQRRGWTLSALAALVAAAAGYLVWDRFWSAPPDRPVSGPQPAVAMTPLEPVAANPVPVATLPSAAPAPDAKPRTKTARTETPTHRAKAAMSAIAARPAGPARIEKVERPYSPEEIAERAYQDALNARQQGDAAGAEGGLQSLLAGNPRFNRARDLLVTVQLESGRWPEAQATLEQGIVRSPDYSPFRLQLARLFLERKSLADAIAVLEDARRTNHADAELLAFLAALQQRAGHSSDATKRYREALALKPGEGRWWVGLGISLESEQKTAEARDAYQKGLVAGVLPDSLVRYAEDRLKVLAR